MRKMLCGGVVEVPQEGLEEDRGGGGMVVADSVRLVMEKLVDFEM